MARNRKGLDPIEIAIQQRLSDEVGKTKLSQREIGALVGISQNRVGIILRGETPPATVGEILAIADVLGIDGIKIITESAAAAANK